MSQEFHVGDIVRIQLSPNGQRFRHDFSSTLKIWLDYGDNGLWVDATIVLVSSLNMVAMHFVNEKGVGKAFSFPIKGHSTYEEGLLSAPGWPKPPSIQETHIPKCDCGCDTTYGVGRIHSDWCAKADKCP